MASNDPVVNRMLISSKIEEALNEAVGMDRSDFMNQADEYDWVCERSEELKKAIFEILERSST